MFKEDSPFAQQPICASKASSDMLIRAYIETGIKAIITRCSNNWSISIPGETFPLVIINSINKKPILYTYDGMNVRDWIYVMDHCKAIDSCTLMAHRDL